MTAIYAQLFARRYLTVVSGSATYVGEEHLDGVSVGHVRGGHDAWVDSLRPDYARAHLAQVVGELPLLTDVIARLVKAGVGPETIEAAVAAATAAGAGESVRFEFDLHHRRGLVCSDEMPGGVSVDHAGVRCRIYARSADGSQPGRAYSQARGSNAGDLDLRGAVRAARAEAEALAMATRFKEPAVLPVLLSPSAAAALLHEICGHSMEADVAAGSGICLADRHGEQVATVSLTVLDDPSRTDLWGGYERDDDGMSAQAVSLIENGIVGHALRGLATAGSAGSNGHGRRVSHQYPAVPRMSNLIVRPGEASRQQLYVDAEGGILIDSIERASLSPRLGVALLYSRLSYRLRDGQLAEPLTGIAIKAPFRTLLSAISDLGAEREAFSGNCGKAGQRIPFGALTPMVSLSEVSLVPY